VSFKLLFGRVAKTRENGKKMSRDSRGVRKILSVGIGALIASVPALSFGLGLGPIKVNSALNEPLDAEIDFTAVSDTELKTFEIGLAPSGAFQAMGIERTATMSSIQFVIARRSSGQPYVHVTTRVPYSEPYLHLLVQAEWAGGRMRREYTALIDPPFLTASRPSAIEAPQVQAPMPAEEMPLAKAEPMPAPQPEVAAEPAPSVQPEAMPPVAEVTPQAEAPKPVAEMPPAAVETAPVAPAQAPVTPVQPLATETQPPAATVEPVASASPTLVETPAVDSVPQRLLGPDHIVPVSAPDWATVDRYRVKRGDTAFDIARRIRRDKSVSLEQVVLALYDTNPNAFFDRNTNNLSAGKILRVPDRETVAKRKPSNARREFLAQYDVWQEYKLKLARSRDAVTVADAAAVTPAPQAEAAPAKPQASAKPGTVPVAPAKPRTGLPEAPKPVEKAAAPKVEAPAKPAAPAATAKVEVAKPKGVVVPPTREARKEELLKIVRANLDKKNGEQSGKPAETESKAETKPQLAERAAAAGGDVKTPPPPTADKAGKPMEGAKDSRPVTVENPALAKPGTEKPAPAGIKTGAPAATPSKPLPVAKKPPAPRKPVAPPPPPKEEDFVAMLMGMLDEVLNNQIILMVAGGVLALVLGVGAIYARRRRKSLSEFEESILTTGDVSTGEFSAGSQNISAGGASDTSFLSDFSQAGFGDISTDDVDPIAEAEVYLAYGRDEQAEEILKDAVVKHPKRHELKEKLLEIYSQRGDVGAFETLAEELYAATEGRGGELWTRVADMGKKLNPGNPMFQGGAPAKASVAPTAAVAAAAESLDFGGTGAGAEGVGALFEDEGAAGDSGDMDFNMDLSIDTSPAVDFSLPGAAPAAAPARGTAAPADTGDLDFNMDLGMSTGGSAEEGAGELGLDFGVAQSGTDLSAAQDDSGGLDFALDAGSMESDEGSTDLDVGGLDFGGAGLGGESEALASDEGDVALSEDDVLDFDALRANKPENNRSGLSLSIATDDADMSFSEEMSLGDAAAQESGLSFEREERGVSAAVAEPGADEGSADQWDEAATKLDLAKAYIDMGDAEGARSILEEVQVEGNADQKRQATELAAQLS
jgi:pilus assembly protein FimV